MTKLTDTQRIILSTASQSTDRLALPLPKNIKGGAALKVINPLIQKGLLEEVAANRKLGDPIWRETGEKRGVTLIITDVGLAAIGVEPDNAPHSATHGEETPEAATAPAIAKSQTVPAPAPRGSKSREGTKQSAMVDLLRRNEGATIDEIAAATGWQKHTIRGAIAGALKKKLGLPVTSEIDEARGRVYRLTLA